jgi:hypothetical protein
MDVLDFYKVTPRSKHATHLEEMIGRTDLARLFAKMGFNVGAEIGVEQGENAERFCLANPDLKLYCVDMWKAYKGYTDYTNQDKLDRYFKTTKERLSAYRVEIMREWSEDASKKFKDESLDFVYLDANHTLMGVLNDLVLWSPKVRKGGIVSGHDYHGYARGRGIRVVEAVNAWVVANDITPWFITAMKEREGERIVEAPRSWFYTK